MTTTLRAATTRPLPMPRTYRLTDGWGERAGQWTCPPAHLPVYLADAFIWGFPAHHRAELGRQITENPHAPARSGEWTLTPDPVGVTADDLLRGYGADL